MKRELSLPCVSRFASRLALSSALALAVLLSPAPGMAQEAGTISGRVTDATSGLPVIGARVLVVGTNLATQTNSAGGYTVRGVPSGPATVRINSIGFGERREQITVAAGQTGTLDFALRPMAVTLSGVVVTATGEQRRVELGNAIARVNARKSVV